MTRDELKELLDALAERYNNPSFIAEDPVSIPHRFSSREDIEIAGFLTATIAWGNRRAIVKNAGRMMEMMGNEPYRFVMESTYTEREQMANFVHRTFNGGDFICFLHSLAHLYRTEGGIGLFFEDEYEKTGDMRVVIHRFRTLFFSCEHPQRAEKHLSSIAKGAACKRINMYLRWMVRRDNRGVDFGLWKRIPSSALYLPLDVHSAAVGRGLGLLERKQNDWRSVEEITANLRKFDSDDPVKYDYALFGVGVNHEFKQFLNE